MCRLDKEKYILTAWQNVTRQISTRSLGQGWQICLCYLSQPCLLVSSIFFVWIQQGGMKLLLILPFPGNSLSRFECTLDKTGQVWQIRYFFLLIQQFSFFGHICQLLSYFCVRIYRRIELVIFYTKYFISIFSHLCKIKVF